MYYVAKNKNNDSSIIIMLIMIILSMMVIINMDSMLNNYEGFSSKNSRSSIVEEPIVEPMVESANEIILPQISTMPYIKTFDEFIAQRANEIQEQKLAEQTVESTQNIHYSDIDVYTDLSVMSTITADDMNKIIEYWENNRYVSTPFSGNGQIFIDAAKESGLDPVYLLAHAAIESAWGNSHYAKTYYNYFGIGAYDSNPDNAINYGNSGIAEGIIEGAKWIARNYYDHGQSSLYTMRYNGGTHEYCTSTTWIYNISNIISESYKVIQS